MKKDLRATSFGSFGKELDLGRMYHANNEPVKDECYSMRGDWQCRLKARSNVKIKFENYIQTNDGDENETPRSSMLYQTDDEDDVSEDIEEDGETLGEDESVQEDI